MTEVLDPLTLPLRGSRLIEASAGTGKTWTIAALVLRLVIGHGHAPRLPGEILVMTFTKAATRELSSRIRQRLVEALAAFRGEGGPPPDDVLQRLLAASPDDAARAQAAWRLAMAAEAMDDAAIHTIDAWCQRMLREHAFDSGCLFDEELQPDEAALRAEALRDYWRQQVYPLEGEALAQVLQRWPEPGALARDLDPLRDKPLPADAGQGSLAEVIERFRQRRAESLAALKDGWDQRVEEMRTWLGAIWQDQQHPARKAVPAARHATAWLEALQAWARKPGIDQLVLTATARQRLSQAGLAANLHSAGLDPAVPRCFAEFDALMSALDQLPELAVALRLHAAAGVAARMRQLKARRGTFGFTDMLERLDAALDESVHGERARRLRERILAQYPVALIDEFQDTSPLQLSIFDRLYRIADDDPARALLLIGDPKQAIYAFRGADIHSYLQAREATRGRHHVLGTNRRSTAGVVEAVNTLFDAAEQRPGEGAFRFRQAASPLPFVPVQAHGRRERLLSSAGVPPAMTLVFDGSVRNGDDCRKLFAALCAERIVALLDDPQAGFEEAGRPWRRLRPADIAVLVRNGREAEVVRQALRRRGLASVYLSDKDSVLRSPEATDLLRLLQAVASPRDVRLVRAALATGLLLRSLPELLELADDELRFDAACEQLQQLNEAWRSQGVLAMLRRALHAFDLPARCLAEGEAAASGERRLTNVLHLAELLQAASEQAEGEQALIRWLAAQIAEDEDAGVAGDERVLRLESDADLVQVVTVHKSKGLEYPLVFLPFAALVRKEDSARDAVLLLPGPAGGRELVLSPTPEQRAAQEHEERREDLRLLYVALTRARHLLWVGLSVQRIGPSAAPHWHRSAFGYLLSGPDPVTPAQCALDLQALAAGCAQVAVQRVPEGDALPLPPATRVRPRARPPMRRAPPPYTAVFDRQWAIASYTALVRDAARGTAPAGIVPARVLREDEPLEAAGSLPGAASDAPWHRFPRGAYAGNLLHEQLEWLAGEGFALASSASLQQGLVRRCERQGWGHRADDLLAWLGRVGSTPLPPLGVPLSGLQRSWPEMEFWFPSDGLDAARIDALCRAHLQPGRERPPLPPRTLAGLLMGFADLVFEHDGRFWVLDYKSNALGTRDADYTPEAMDAAMLEHRYDVQAALYLLALHRLLASRLGAAYEPQRQLGGALYLFLRGIHAPSAGCCTVAPPLELIGELDATLPRGTAGSPAEAR